MKIKISQKDNGRGIDLKVGDVLSLELAENPTTGYRWSVPMPLPDCLELVRDAFTRAGGGLGAGGRREYEIGAKAPGDFRLTLYLRREWEEPNREVQTFTLSGRVRPAET